MLRKILKLLLPYKIYSFLKRIYFFITRIPSRIRIARKKITPYSAFEPKVSYASMVPHNRELIGGGRSKLIYLNNVFPEQDNKFNILYIVSSTLPTHLDIWIKKCKQKDVKIVLNQNGVYYNGWYGAGWEEANAFLKIALHSVDYIMYQSRFSKMSADRFLGQANVPWDIIYNAVDTSVFTPAQVDRDDVGLIILMAGTHSQSYRFELALQTISILKQRNIKVKLNIAGRLNWLPNERRVYDSVYKLLNTYNVRDIVKFIKPYTQREAPDIFRRAHILLHTQYNDVCPTTVIEAMASGLPVVFLNTGGTPELVGNDAGIGVDCEFSWEKIMYPEPGVLAEAILKIAAERTKFSEAARQRAVKLFDLNNWINKHRLIFEKIL